MPDMFEFDDKRAEKILPIIHYCYLKGSHLYRYYHAKNGSAPQHKYVPKGMERGSAKHQLFLFFASILTYHSQSDMGFQQCVMIYNKNPDFFKIDVCKKSLEEMQFAFREVGFIYPNEVARRWLLSAQGLFNKYDGDPLAIFKIGSIAGVMKEKGQGNKNVFPGFGPKLFSLLSLFYEELELIDPILDAFPCDVHVQAQCIGLGLAKSNQEIFSTTPFAEFLRRNISNVCREKNISALDLSHAQWFLGNRLCMYCKRKRAISEKFCPVFNYCGGRVSTAAYRKKGLWDITKIIVDPLPLFNIIKAG